MTNLDSILKSRDITLPMNVLLVKATVFPVVLYVCKSWTIKKPEHQRIDAFELCCWIRLLRVPWTTRRSNLSILKEINPEYSLEVWCWSWSSNMLATWCKELTHLEKTLMLGKIEGRRRRGQHKMSCVASPSQWTWVWVSSGSWCWTGKPGMLQSVGAQRVKHNWVTELKKILKMIYIIQWQLNTVIKSVLN